MDNEREKLDKITNNTSPTETYLEIAKIEDTTVKLIITDEKSTPEEDLRLLVAYVDVFREIDEATRRKSA